MNPPLSHRTMKHTLLTAALALICTAALHAEGLEIHRVVPGKILYRVNEPGTVEVVLGNPTASPRKAEVRLVTRWDMDKKREIGKQAVSLAPGEVKSLTFPWKAGPERYGRAVEAQVIEDGKVAGTKSEFFNVINEWWRVNLCGQRLMNYGGGELAVTPKDGTLYPLRRKVLDSYHLDFAPSGSSAPQEVVGPFLGYDNHQFNYAGAPSIFGDLVPEKRADDVTWYSGSGLYPFTAKKLKTEAEWRKTWGVKTSVYTDKSFTGPVGAEIARRHPEWVARKETGAFDEFGYASPSPVELAKPDTVKMSGWFGFLPDLYNPDALQYGIDALLETTREFGWDAVFWDGCGYVVGPFYNYKGEKLPGDLDPEVVSAENVRKTNESLWKEFPEMYLWYNGANPANVGSFHPSGNGGGRKGKIQMMTDPRSGGLKELQCFQIADPTNAAHSWRSLFEIYLDARDSIRKKDWGTPLHGIVHSGFLFPEYYRHSMPVEDFNKTREQWAWSNHAISLMAAAQLHFSGGGTAFRPMNQLMTRYSRYFWDEDIRILDKAYKQFELDSLREIWWEDSVYERKTDRGREVIFNLVNTPDSETAHKKIVDDPKVADDVEITCLDIHDAKGVRAWAVRPYDYESTVLEPVQVEIKPEIVEGNLVLRVPPFRYFTLVVLDIPNK